MTIKSKFDLGQYVYYPSADRQRAVVIGDKISAIVCTEEGVKYLTPYTQYGLDEKDISKTFKGAQKRLDLKLVEKGEEVKKEISDVLDKVRNASKGELLFDASPKQELLEEPKKKALLKAPKNEKTK